MSLSATVVAELVAAGLEGAALVAACARIENADNAAGASGFGGTKADIVSGFGGAADPLAERPDKAAGGVGAAELRGTASIDKQMMVARRALNSARELSPAARLVGLCLLDHFNTRTGRCDPGIARIAGLCELSERTVRRAVRALDAAGLIACEVHAGRGHSNAYRPDFAALRRRVMAADARLSGFAQRRTRQTAKPDTVVPQTQNGTQNEESLMGAPGAGGRKRSRKVDRRQIPMMLPMSGGRDVDRGQIALQAAHKRLFADVCEREWPPGTSGLMALVEGEVGERAAKAEMRRPGAGVELIAAELKRTGTDPP